MLFLLGLYYQLCFRQFNFASSSVRFAIIRYNTDIDTKYQILLKDYPDNKTRLLEAFSSIPYESKGKKKSRLQ